MEAAEQTSRKGDANENCGRISFWFPGDGCLGFGELEAV